MMAHFPGKINCNQRQSRVSQKNYLKFTFNEDVNCGESSVDLLKTTIERGLRAFYFLFSDDFKSDEEKSFDGFTQVYVEKRREELLSETRTADCEETSEDNEEDEEEEEEEDESHQEDEEHGQPGLPGEPDEEEHRGHQLEATCGATKEELINDAVFNCQTEVNCEEEDEEEEESIVFSKKEARDELRISEDGPAILVRDAKCAVGPTARKHPKLAGRRGKEDRRAVIEVKNGSNSVKAVCSKDSLRNGENNGGMLGLQSDTASSPESLSSPSSIHSCNSAAKKEAIRRNMVARYAEIMMSGALNGLSDNEDKVDDDEKIRYTSKIERLLKSQWEDRLKKQSDLTQDEDGRHSSSPMTPSGTTTTTTTSTSVTPEPIIRKAKLQLNSKTLLKLRQPSSLKHLIFDESNVSPTLLKEAETNVVKKRSSNGGRPGYITCAICNITKYYSHVQRRHGQYSCEPCSKFFARFCRNPKQLYCPKNGDCPISVDHQEPIATSSKCRACWLKLCLQKFIIDPSVREHISANYAPKLESSPNVSLIAVDTSQGHNLMQEPMTTKESSSLLMLATDKEDESSKKGDIHKLSKNGPRVKRVCRSVDVIKGLPRATFGSVGQENEEDDEEDDIDDNDSDDIPIDVYICRAYAKEMREKSRQSLQLETGVNGE